MHFCQNLMYVSWLLWGMLQWTLEYRYLFDLLISFPLHIYTYLGVGLVDHMVVLFLYIFWCIFFLFSKIPALIYIFTNSMQGFVFLHIFTNTCYMDCKNVDCKMVITRGWGLGMLGRCCLKDTKFQWDRRNKFKGSIVHHAEFK